MDQGPLVTEQIAAGARFLAEFQKAYPVKNAFWLKDAEGGAWWLYVASEQISDENFDVAYEEVARIGPGFRGPWFDYMQVKVIGADHSVAKAAADALRRYPGRPPLRLVDMPFGGVFAEEVYIYPPIPAPAPTS